MLPEGMVEWGQLFGYWVFHQVNPTPSQLNGTDLVQVEGVEQPAQGHWAVQLHSDVEVA